MQPGVSFRIANRTYCIPVCLLPKYYVSTAQVLKNSIISSGECEVQICFQVLTDNGKALWCSSSTYSYGTYMFVILMLDQNAKAALVTGNDNVC